MKILYIGLDKALPFLREHAGPETDIDASVPKDASGPIESRYDELLYSPAVVERAIWAEGQGYDGCITACFADCGVLAAREVVSIPVVGPGMSSMAMASLLCDRFSIVTALDRSIGRLRERAVALGVEDKLASIRAVGIRVGEMSEAQERGIKSAVEIGHQCIQEDGAEALVMGCGSMAAFAFAVQDALQVPVINPLLVSLKTAEAVIGSSLTHSKRTYPMPLSMS